MNRDSSRCGLRSNGFCGVEHDSYTADKNWYSEVSALIGDVLEHSLQHGLDRVYRLCWEAGRYLIEDDVDQCRVSLARAIVHADDPGRWLIRDTLQLLEALDDDDLDEATDADVARAVSGGDD